MKSIALSLLGIALLLGTITSAARAQTESPATWPTVGQLIGKSITGDWAKYEQSQTAGLRTQTGHFWQTYGGKVKDKDSHLITSTQSLEPGAPAEPPTEQGKLVRIVTTPLDAKAPFPVLPLPPGVKVTRDQITSSPFKDLKLAGESFSGTRYTRELHVELPNAAKLQYKVTLWTSPQVRPLGVVKQIVEMSGASMGTQTITLVTTSGIERELARSLNFASPNDLLVHSEKMAHKAWNLNDKGQLADAKASHFLKGDVDTWRSKMGLAAAEMDMFEWALKIRATLDPGIAREMTDALYKSYSLAGNRTALKALGVRTDDHLNQLIVETRAAELARNAEYQLPELIAFVKGQPTDNLRRMAVGRALREDGLQVEAIKALLAELPDDAARTEAAQSKVIGLANYRPDPEAIDRFGRAHPPLTATARFHASKARALAATNRAVEAGPAIEQAMKLLAADPDRLDPKNQYPRGEAMRALIEAMKLARDKRYVEVARQRLEEDYAIFTKRLAETPALEGNSHVAQVFATVRALRGDRAAAQAALAKAYLTAGPAQVETVIAFHALGGKIDDAIAWRDALKPLDEDQKAGRTYRKRAIDSEVNLGFARHAWYVRDEAAYVRWIKLAIDEALAGNEAIIAFNKAQTDRAKLGFWRTDILGQEDPPYLAIVRFLTENPGEGNDALLVDMLKRLKTEMPATNGAGDAWREAAQQTAERGNASGYKAVIAAMPAAWGDNWFTGNLAESIRPIAARLEDGKGNVAFVREVVALLPKPHWKAELLRSAIGELAAKDRRKDMAALMIDMKAATEMGASPQHYAFATVAVAKCHASFGDVDAALAAFTDRKTDLREQIPVRGVNGRHWASFLYDLGLEVGRNAAEPYETATAWCKAVKYPYEAAALAAGLARGIYMREYAK